MKNIKKIIREEIEDFNWIQNQKPEPWEEFMFPYTELKGRMENTIVGEKIVYRDENGKWIFYHEQNLENKFVWFNYERIWGVLKLNLGFNYSKIQKALTKWLKEHYNLNDIKAINSQLLPTTKLQEFKNQHTSSSDHNICDVMTINSLEEILELLKGMDYGDNKSEIESILTNMEQEKKELSNNVDILNNYLRKVQNILCV